MAKIFYFLVFIFFCFKVGAQESDQQLSLIPQPLQMEQHAGYFKLDRNVTVKADGTDAELDKLADLFLQGVYDRTGLSLKKGKSDEKGKSILFEMVPDTLGNEGYRLSVTDKELVVQAAKANGIFYGIQTIYQLLPTDQRKSILLPSLSIVDKPRFGWRGLMLDVGRYFYSVEYVKKFIDYLSMHKLNVFHWHLTEDHGWRIAIKKYPRLTEVGAWRSGTNFQPGNNIDHNPHGGFYTQEEIKEVVAYAKDRYVTVVPEIELPGHSLAALAAYPDLSCTGGPFQIPEKWGIQEDIYCAGKEEVFVFLENVLAEVFELFPSEIIHIGGDEAPKKRWSACPHCQKRIKEEGLKDEHELQSYFITRVERFLNSKGRKIIGWDEILEGGLAPNAAVMSWRGTKGGIAAAKMGHPVVMTPTSHMYFDYFQGEPYLEPYAIWGHVPLRKVYGYEPVPEELTIEEQKYILGVQGNLWSEFIHSPEMNEYMTYPRGAALAEIAWSNAERKDWEDFKRRLEEQYNRYEQKGINYSRSAYQVYFEVTDDVGRNTSTVNLLTDSYQPEIYYTLDGSEPTLQSSRFEGPFEVPIHKTVRAATFKDGQRISPVSLRSIVHF
ncbi:family 20 glycosylhydrolase [Sphingobacterium sp. DN00404]|uniref:beta-N-acetylhexosaminidase n=1 Tax=Sphingobacterium micropteri TaxID=2763501 RepID=A0ABR7YNJ0_9SPHI|nr:family 20 glycosylhydrolase [Sphingobacterium micropteri]MBD1432908.1 family 20 glycosylhydrolase [Sphingobacterium micropteri]